MQAHSAIDHSVIGGIRAIQPPGENLVAKIVELFLQEADRLGRCLEQSISDADWESAGKHAHSLKSCSANVGAMQVSALSHDLESACRGQTDAEVPATFARLRDSLQLAVDELRSLDLSCA